MIAPLMRHEVLVAPAPDAPDKKTYRRVVWVNDEFVWLIDIGYENPPKWPVPELLVDIMHDLEHGPLRRGEVAQRPHYSWPDADPDAPDYAADDPTKISTDHQAIRDERWRAIESLVQPEAVQAMLEHGEAGKRVRKAAKASSHSREYIYMALKLYWMHGGAPNALLPLTWRCGAPGIKKPDTDIKRGRERNDVTSGHAPERVGVNMKHADRELIVAMFIESWDPKMTVARFTKLVHKKVASKATPTPAGILETVLPPLHTMVSKGQVSYCLEQDVGPYFMIKKSHGPQTFNLSKRGLKKRTRDGIYFPTQRYEIDSTVLDLYLVSVFNRAWLIGRPIVYFVVDVMSGAIVGFHVALHGPDGVGAKIACFNAYSDKSNFLSRLGIQSGNGYLPMHHGCRTLTSDRGEMLCRLVHKAFDKTETILRVLPGARGDLKPHVEVMFRVAQEKFVHWLPGAVRKRGLERGDRDYRLDACLNIYELNQLLTVFVQFHNLTKDATAYAPLEAVADHIGHATPASLWEWGLVNMDGQPIVLPRSDLIPRFLQPLEASVARDSLYVGSARYSGLTPDAEKWSTIARSAGRSRVPVFNEPTFGNEVYWLNPKTGLYESFTRLDSNIPKTASLIEVADRDAYQEQLKRDAAEAKRALEFSLEAATKAIVDPASAEAKDARAGMSAAAITADIGAKRRAERDAMSGQAPGSELNSGSRAEADGEDEVDDDLLKHLLIQQMPTERAA